MKKILLILMAAFVFVPVAAEETKTTVVSYNVPESYTWAAPADINFGNDENIVDQTGQIIVENSILDVDSKLVIRLDTQEFNIQCGTIKKAYRVSQHGETRNPGDTVFVLPSGITSGSKDIDFSLTERELVYSGTYTGTLNFKATVETIPSYPVMLTNDVDSSGKISKGDLVTVNDASYRVLKTLGKRVTLYSIAPYGESYKYATSLSVKLEYDNGNLGAKYTDSNLHNAAKAFIASLPADMQAAIMQTDTVQSMYDVSTTQPESGDYITVKGKYFKLIDSKTLYDVYARPITLQEIYDYFGGDMSNINALLYNSDMVYDENTWLLDAAYDDSYPYALKVNGNTRAVERSRCDTKYTLHPVFTINAVSLSGS